MTEKTIIHSRAVIIGDSLVGKTSIFNKLAFNTFSLNEKTTVGSNYQLYIQQIQDIRVELQVWDTAGQERFRSLGAIYFRDADAALAVYDITNRDSFVSLERWINEFVSVAGEKKTVVVIANKCDLAANSQVPFDEAEGWALSKNYMIRQVSAKTGDGIKDLFSDLTYTILENQMSSPITIPTGQNITEQTNKKSSCC